MSISVQQSTTSDLRLPILGDGQRLADRILAAAHAAIDGGQRDVARSLLDICEAVVRATPEGMDRRTGQEDVVAALERLFLLRK